MSFSQTTGGEPMPQDDESTPVEPREPGKETGGSLPPVWRDVAKESAKSRIVSLEDTLETDVLTIFSPILYGLEHLVRHVVEQRGTRREGLTVILDTSGGVVEVAERIARVFRNYYREVQFLVPDKALSAGTVLVMSGDAIMMDYHSVLGPIDPQIERDGKLVPALSYLTKYDELSKKANAGELAAPDMILLQKLDLAELHQFELARSLSIQLLKEWLAEYKFKDWKVTETRGVEVTPKMRKDRAQDIAEQLNDQERWGSHGRGIPMDVLQSELKLKIDDFGKEPDLQRQVWNYFWFLRDYVRTNNFRTFLHSPDYF